MKAEKKSISIYQDLFFASLEILMFSLVIWGIFIATIIGILFLNIGHEIKYIFTFAVCIPIIFSSVLKTVYTINIEHMYDFVLSFIWMVENTLLCILFLTALIISAPSITWLNDHAQISIESFELVLTVSFSLFTILNNFLPVFQSSDGICIKTRINDSEFEDKQKKKKLSPAKRNQIENSRPEPTVNGTTEAQDTTIPEILPLTALSEKKELESEIKTEAKNDRETETHVEKKQFKSKKRRKKRKKNIAKHRKKQKRKKSH